jgi:hypothetical protein
MRRGLRRGAGRDKTLYRLAAPAHDRAMWPILLLLQTSAGEVIDLTKLPPPCPKGEDDEIVVCGSAGESPYRLKPLPPLPDKKKRVAGPGIGLQLAPGVRTNAYGETVGLEGGGQATRAMVRLTIDF